MNLKDYKKEKSRPERRKSGDPVLRCIRPEGEYQA